MDDYLLLEAFTPINGMAIGQFCTLDALDIDGHKYIKDDKAKSTTLRFVKKMIDENLLKIIEGNENYFSELFNPHP